MPSCALWKLTLNLFFLNFFLSVLLLIFFLLFFVFIYLFICTANSKRDTESTPVKGGNVADLGMCLKTEIICVVLN